MIAQPDPELVDDDNPEWTEEDFAKAVPFSALPEALKATLSALQSESEARRAAGKRLISLELDQDIVEHFHATGPGWEKRVNESLRKFLPPRS